MRKNHYLFLLFIIIVSCKKEASDIKLTYIQPLGVGYYWEFIDSTFSETGSLLYVDTSRVGITGKSEVNYEGEMLELYHWNWYDWTKEKYISQKWLCNNDKSGFCFYGGITSNGSYIFEKSISILYPVKVNDSWDEKQYSYKIINDSSFFYISDTITKGCESVSEDFVTVFGKLNCYKIKYNRQIGNKTEEVSIYQSRDIGYVGLIAETKGIITFKKTLKSYSLVESSMKLESISTENGNIINCERFIYNP
jgi:hypothetical protein